MTQWLTDTFVWTSVLIAAVLLLRRPVARHFGPQVAYALWALPLLRLLMPPVVLPASFAPVEAEPAAAAALVLVHEAPVAAAGFALTDLLLPLWLGGAVLFLVWRAADYLRMRRELLADARPVGEAGAVRLVETPDVASPVAFGLRDKVVALPVGFMAQPDLSARNLALAHELAHHRGHDLLANLSAQPLLALHWFNPLAWLGWRAMRSDQEAACDARVIAGCERAERAAYAQVIATFAAGPRLALAAPMACPVLGEKSIIHRLRSLTMSDVSSTRRKLGLAAIATGALVALPLTASVSYGQAETPAAETEPQRVIRFQLRREGEEVQAPAAEANDEASDEASDEAAEPQIRRRMIIRRNGVDQVIEDGVDEAEIEGLIDTDSVCPEGASTTRRELADGRQLVIVCRREAYNQATTGLRQARDAIRNSAHIGPETRDTIIRELEAEIAQMEAEQLSFAAPQPPAPPAPPKASAVRVVFMPGSALAPRAGTLVVLPAAMLDLLVLEAPVVPDLPESDLPI